MLTSCEKLPETEDLKTLWNEKKKKNGWGTTLFYTATSIHKYSDYIHDNLLW